MKTPFVSIITPNYNSEDYIKNSIESVISQTYLNWEMIIIDDASTDNSIEIIESYLQKDKRIKLIKLEKNAGPAVARNNGIELAKGDFIAFLDSDDAWLAAKLEDQIKFMLEKEIAFSFSSYYSQKNNFQKLINAKETIVYNDLLLNNYIGCLTVMYSVHLLGKQYFPLIRKRQDWALWLKITRNGTVAYGMPKPLAIYNNRRASLSSNKISLLRYNWFVYRNFEGINIFRSILLILNLLLIKIFK
jgi:glycosyltransferase involved in cell wall biosynthesis